MQWIVSVAVQFVFNGKFSILYARDLGYTYVVFFFLKMEVIRNYQQMVH